MMPIVDGLEQKYEQVTVKRVNAATGEGPQIMQAFRIPGHPTILLFDKDGQERPRVIGPQPADVVEAAVQEILP